MILVYQLILSAFFGVLVFGYLADPSTYYEPTRQDYVWFGTFCIFFPQVASWITVFNLYALVGASAMALCGFFQVFLFGTSIFKHKKRLT